MSSKLENDFDEITLGSLQQWIATRNDEAMPYELGVYLEQLDKVYGWHQSMALENEIINNLLTHYPLLDGNRSKAKQLYADAINHFYLDATITQEAWANVYADRLDRMAILIMKTADNAGELAKVKDLWKEAATLRGVYAEKKEQLPKEFYEKRYNLYTNKIEDLGLEPMDRPEIMEMIDGLPLSAEENLRIKQEADIGVPRSILNWDEPESEDK